MPEGYTPARPYPGRRYRLKDAAEANQLVIVRCVGCRRTVRYIAADLCLLLDPRGDADAVPFACSKCRTVAHMRVTLHPPALGDYGHLVVRRPGPVKHIQTWKTVRLGD